MGVKLDLPDSLGEHRLRVIRGQEGEYLELQKRKDQEDRENYIVKNFMICTLMHCFSTGGS
jgi:hypothetical protein